MITLLKKIVFKVKEVFSFYWYFCCRIFQWWETIWNADIFLIYQGTFHTTKKVHVNQQSFFVPSYKTKSHLWKDLVVHCASSTKNFTFLERDPGHGAIYKWHFIKEGREREGITKIIIFGKFQDVLESGGKGLKIVSLE